VDGRAAEEPNRDFGGACRTLALRERLEEDDGFRAIAGEALRDERGWGVEGSGKGRAKGRTGRWRGRAKERKSE
jgi:hypothetical protein